MKKIKDVNLSPGVKASLAFFFASIVTKGIAYITTPLYTRLLTTEEYGQTALFLTWLEIFGIIAMFCLSYGVFNNGMIDYPEKRDEYSFSMLILSNIITLVFSGIIFCLYPIFKSVIRLDFPFIILMCVLYFFQPAYSFWTARQRYEYKYKAVVTWTIVSAILSPLVALFFIVSSPNGNRLYPRIFGAEVSLICIYIVFYIHLAYKAKFHINVKYWKAALLFNLPLIPHYLSTYLLNSSDRIMISNLVGNNATAYYSLAYTVASIALIVWSAVNSSLIPFTYEKCKVGDYKSINNIILPILVIFAGCSLCVIMFAPEIIQMLATKSYMEAIYVIPPVVGGVFFQVQYFIYANVVYYYKKPNYVMIGSVSAVILNMILNFIFIKRFGYVAAGYTTLFCYIVQAIIDYIGMKKAVGENVYNMKFIFILSTIVIIVSLFSSFTYSYPIVRYGIVALLCIICFIKHKKIISTFKIIMKKVDGAKEVGVQSF